jgi:hypothetical protein
VEDCSVYGRLMKLGAVPGVICSMRHRQECAAGPQVEDCTCLPGAVVEVAGALGSGSTREPAANRHQ